MKCHKLTSQITGKKQHITNNQTIKHKTTTREETMKCNNQTCRITEQETKT